MQTSTTSDTPDNSPSPPGSAPPTFGYQPALDGIRAIAIVSVLLFHYVFHNHLILPHGLLGVDAFFVLSGFLITALLLREHGTKRRISLRNFYARRALRLLPLLGCVLIVAVIVNLAFPPGYPGRPQRQGIVAAAFYYANWYTLRHSTGLGFLGVTWSLSIEEQFYLVWPVLLVALLSVTTRRSIVALTTFAAFLAAVIYRMSFFYRYHPVQPSFVEYYFRLTGRGRALKQQDPGISRVYFGSDTRAHQLLLGCFLAALLLWIVPHMKEPSRRVLRVLGVIGAAVMTAILLDWPGTSRVWLDHWGAMIFEVAVAVLIAAIVVIPGSLLARALAVRPVRWTGQRAYGIYLIHPIIYQYLGDFHLGAWGALGLHLGVVFGLAAFSYRFIETPALRLKDRFASAGGRTSVATA
jgi:peptidoglycan/LPS O-acetylase OafA/YrhL